jgi:polar amino acid transport system substrate-binding protein
MVNVSADVVKDLAADGVLRASINLGNPVLAQGTPEEPTGVTVDIAREIAARLGVSLELICFDAARKSFEAMTSGQADICFLAIDPARAEEVAFTAPYVVIEGVFAVPVDSPLTTVDEVDSEGIRIGVKRGSAYDLYLSRTLQHATVVQGEEGVDVFRSENLEVAAGIRQPITDYVSANPDLRVIPTRFMQIQQAVGTSKSRTPATIAYLHTFIEDLKSSGFIATSLKTSNRPDATVAPPAE